VPLYEYGEADGWHFLVLEYIPGGSLKARLTGPLPPREAARLVERIARAVAYIHGQGLLHLDLKPSNILLDGEGDTSWDRATPRVSDFGLALFDDPDDSAASLAGLRGAPCYTAPEQTGIPSSKIGPTADVYALGAILFEVLTGRPPFQGASIYETIEQVRGQSPVHPRSLNPAIPRDLETICLKCLEKDPDRRYASAGAMADDLNRFLDGRPISARPVSTFEKARRWCWRRPAIASLIAALALTLVGGFLGVFALWRFSEAQRARAEIERAHADAARRLAEDNERLASRTLNELSGVLFSALEHPETLSEDRIFELIHFLRQQARESRNARGVGPWCVPGVGVLERVLAVKLFDRGQRSEARSLLADGVAYLKECRRLDPDDQKLLRQLGHALLNAGHLAARDSALDEALVFYDQSSSGCGALALLSDRVELVDDLYLARQALAMRLTGRGESERARRLMEAARRAFVSLEVPDVAHPDRMLPQGRTSEDVETARRTIERLRAALRASPEDPQLRGFVERYAIDLVIAAILPFPREADLLGESSDRKDSEARAESLVSSIRSRCRAFGLDERLAPNVALKLTGIVTGRAAEQRRIDQLRAAEGTVGRLMAFARRLVRHYPDQPESHMVLSEAYLQVSKNAWKREDYPAIERALRQALESARHAAHLDPRYEDARLLVERIVPRLALFDTGRAKPK
jgi:hypothetical protein